MTTELENPFGGTLDADDIDFGKNLIAKAKTTKRRPRLPLGYSLALVQASVPLDHIAEDVPLDDDRRLRTIIIKGKLPEDTVHFIENSGLWNSAKYDPLITAEFWKACLGQPSLFSRSEKPLVIML